MRTTNFFALLTRGLNALAAKLERTDLKAWAGNVWEGYHPVWTPNMVRVGLLILTVSLVAGIVMCFRRRIRPSQLLFGWLLILYLYLMFGSTVFSRVPTAASQANFNLFWEYKSMLAQHSWYLAKQIFLNIAMLMPVGFLFPLSRGKRCFWQTLLFGFACSLSIEVMQYVFHCGLFEFDDIFNNTLGTFIGYMLYRIIIPKRAVSRKRR
ncbi:VanZ family protein [Pseudoramibacter sp.]|jgi:glycopeptide antibiotics resistance protein|uniref:VanZ family protein n=1 Tax=Pseudoramibacter sp. TaxID=2034862 RepID=UPI0025CDAE95|nr:VanZ family protein [Pseudoramibacter sp.]MCH4073115.1 VanZ family protein [Pseudoramibacter sp.]MCH4106887.1 VanZ family protein [Pseudoramibacter sp.]